MYIAHVTDKKNLDKIKKDGYKCRDYFSKHPIGRSCTTFSYPLNGVDNQLKFRPQNARMLGENIDDEIYVIFDIDSNNCIVGDMQEEANETEYKKTMMPLNEYQKESEYYRHKFREPEVVCYNSIPPEKIIAVLTHSEMKKLFESCPDRNKTECMTNSIYSRKKPTPEEMRAVEELVETIVKPSEEIYSAIELATKYSYAEILKMAQEYEIKSGPKVKMISELLEKGVISRIGW